MHHRCPRKLVPTRTQNYKNLRCEVEYRTLVLACNCLACPQPMGHLRKGERVRGTQVRVPFLPVRRVERIPGGSPSCALDDAGRASGASRGDASSCVCRVQCGPQEKTVNLYMLEPRQTTKLFVCRKRREREKDRWVLVYAEGKIQRRATLLFLEETLFRNQAQPRSIRATSGFQTERKSLPAVRRLEKEIMLSRRKRKQYQVLQTLANSPQGRGRYLG